MISMTIGAKFTVGADMMREEAAAAAAAACIGVAVWTQGHHPWSQRLRLCWFFWACEDFSVGRCRVGRGTL